MNCSLLNNEHIYRISRCMGFLFHCHILATKNERHLLDFRCSYEVLWTNSIGHFEPAAWGIIALVAPQEKNRAQCLDDFLGVVQILLAKSGFRSSHLTRMLEQFGLSPRSQCPDWRADGVKKERLMNKYYICAKLRESRKIDLRHSRFK